ncbi:hypothetical protein D3C71_1998140 [compost metagenome]
MTRVATCRPVSWARLSSDSCQSPKLNMAPYIRAATCRFSARKITQPTTTSRKVKAHLTGLKRCGLVSRPSARSIASHMPCQAPQMM